MNFPHEIIVSVTKFQFLSQKVRGSHVMQIGTQKDSFSLCIFSLTLRFAYIN